MRIALDARWIFGEISGVGLYTRELIRNLSAIDRENEYVLLFNDERVMGLVERGTGFGRAVNFSPVLLSHSVLSPKNQCLLPGFLSKKGIDVYHSPNWIIPFMAFPRGGGGRTKCVVTVHDVIPMLFPDHAPRAKKARFYPLYRGLMREVGKRSDFILTVSERSRLDIIKCLEIPEGRTHCVKRVYNGVDARFKPSAEKGNREEKIVLYVGRADPYKNLAVLMKAFHKVLKEGRVRARLVIAGASDPRYPEADELARSLGIGGSVDKKGYLDGEELVKVYQEADVLVHPSRYEGFGLQVLEAMACGVPVISSDGGSLPEVVGDAGILICQDDVDGFAGKIADVLTDSSLAGALSRKGLERASEFTWRKSAEGTLECYREAVGTGDIRR